MGVDALTSPVVTAAVSVLMDADVSFVLELQDMIIITDVQTEKTIRYNFIVVELDKKN